MHNQDLRFQKWDIFAIAVLIFIGAVVFALFLPAEKSSAAYAEIYLGGQLIQTLSLGENQELSVTGTYKNTIAVRDGKIAVIDSDCPGRDCVACGWSGSAGRSIVCLPNCLEIRIIGSDDDVDFVVG